MPNTRAACSSSRCRWRRRTRSTTAPAQSETARSKNPNRSSQEDGDTSDYSNWDYYERGYYDGEINWNERDDPCKPAYYRYGRNIRAARNLLASNIGLIAKRAQRGKLLAVATALDTAKPLAGVKVDAMSYQNQVMASGRTDSNGMVELDPRGTPFALIADDGGRKGYLRVANGSRAAGEPLRRGWRNRGRRDSRDTSTATAASGVRATLSTSPSRCRTGRKTLPPDHPVTVELRNPRGQLVQTLTNSKPVGQFYTFELKTAAGCAHRRLERGRARRRRHVRQDAEGRDGHAEPSQDRARSRREAGHRKLAAQGRAEGAMVVRRHGRVLARGGRSAAARARPRASRATPTTCSTIRRVRSRARRSRCSTVSSTPTARRGSKRISTCHAMRRACSTPRSSRACSSAAAPSASIARRAPWRRSTGMSASSCPRATRRATCCSPTPNTWSNWPR